MKVTLYVPPFHLLSFLKKETSTLNCVITPKEIYGVKIEIDTEDYNLERGYQDCINLTRKK